ncbi:MAG: hypothetical protein JEZ08_00755 [Clostridiales bacterium]|nr:hypothetical protein [Clostridiales bacterium]
MKKIRIKWIIPMLLCLALISCSNEKTSIQSDKEAAGTGVEAIEVSSRDGESLVEVTGGQENVVKMVSDYADEMNLTTNELEEMIHELSLIEAHKNSIGIGEYLESIESNGQTAFEVQKLLADTLGMTIVELYNYQVYNDVELSEEQQENNANIANALTEVSNIDVSGLTNSGLREVSGEINELLQYNAYEIVGIEEDEFGTGCEFLTYDSIEEVSEYYIELLKGTANFTSVVIDGEGAQVTGTINGGYVYVIMEYLGDSISVLYSLMQ